MLRPIEEWKSILRDLAPLDAAKFLLGDLIAYRSRGNYEGDDTKQLANALEAWASLPGGGPIAAEPIELLESVHDAQRLVATPASKNAGIAKHLRGFYLASSKGLVVREWFIGVDTDKKKIIFQSVG